MKAVIGTFSGIPNKMGDNSLEAVQIYSTISHLTPVQQKEWQEIYEKEMQKPHFSCGNPEVDKERRHRYASRSADIALNQCVWTIK